jgi:nitrate reductase NapAB chaperone NapD
MWISSFVVTFNSESAACEVTEGLNSIPALTPGERHGLKLPVLVEAPDGSTSRYWHEWVTQLPGVVQVEVAFVSFDESDERTGESLTVAEGVQHG